MRYSDIRSGLNSGDILVCSHHPWKTISDVESHIVRMACESEYSHVAVILVKDGVPHVIEAIVPQVCVSPLEKYLDYGFFLIQTPDKPMTSEEESYGLSHVGDQYSKVQAVEGFFNMLDIAQDLKWQCSELTISMRRLSGLDLGPTATPAAVVQRALSLGYTLQFIEKG